MTDYILSLEIGLLALIVIGGLALLGKQIERLHKDVRRCIELGFWEQRRSRRILKKRT